MEVPWFAVLVIQVVLGSNRSNIKLLPVAVAAVANYYYFMSF